MSFVPNPENPTGGNPRTSSDHANAAPGLPDPSRAKPFLAGWLRDVIISLAVSAFFIIFLYQPVRVEGTSMMPTLQDQERVFINKFVYKLEPIERSDVIVFRYPRDPAKSYIKRVIAVAGDRVKIDDGVVYVNVTGCTRRMSRKFTKTCALIPRPWCHRTATLCWEIIATCPTTAAISARSMKTSSTARQSSDTGR